MRRHDDNSMVQDDSEDATTDRILSVPMPDLSQGMEYGRQIVERSEERDGGYGKPDLEMETLAQKVVAMEMKADKVKDKVEKIWKV